MQPMQPAAAPVPELQPVAAARTLGDWLDVHDGILLTRGYKAQTIKNRRSNLAHVRRLWGTVPVAELKPHAVASALRTFPKEKSSTAVRVLAELREWQAKTADLPAAPMPAAAPPPPAPPADPEDDTDDDTADQAARLRVVAGRGG
jgi:hypothetical protein